MAAVLPVWVRLQPFSWSDSVPGSQGSMPSLQQFINGGGGPITAFSKGFGVFTDPILGTFGALFGMTMLNAFVLTTLDTSVRLGRFITSELVGPVAGIAKNRYQSPQ